MSKKIHTIQSSDKKEFDKKVNFFLEFGCELHDGGYEVIKHDDGVVYSQVVMIDTNKCGIEFDDDGKIKEMGNYKDGYKNGKWTYWWEDGNIESEGTYKDGECISEQCWDRGGYEIDCWN